MSIPVSIVSTDTSTSERLATLIPTDVFDVTTCQPGDISGALPDLFVLALPGLNTPEEQLIEKLRADDATARIPIVIVSTLPMIELQSVPYASDWTIAIVEDPVDANVLVDTMHFLINPDQG